MYTLGYQWRPWRGDRALADGASILQYVRDVAEEHGVDRLIRYDHRVVAAAWDSATARWTVEVDRGGERTRADHRLPVGLLGLLRLRRGLHARLPRHRATSAAGSCTRSTGPRTSTTPGKRVVVIGSGATAVTLVPAMAAEAGHVTMLQRSPTYVLSLPERDPLAQRLEPAARAGVLPDRPVEEHPARDGELPAQPQAARRAPRADPQGHGPAAARPHRRRHPLQADVRPLGPAAVLRARRRPVPGAAPGHGLGRHRHHRDLHRARHPARRRARSSRPTSWSRPPG